MKVKDVMTPGVITVQPEASLKDVASLLAEHGISGVPVVDAGGKVLGVVSKTDILIKERAAQPEQRGVLALLRGGGDDSATAVKVEARTAREAMTSPVIAVQEERDLAAAAGLMLDHRINRMPVLRGDQLVGIITRADLVRAFTRSDEAIEQEIRDEILQRTFWLPAGAVEVTVTEGVVQLLGEVETRADAEMLPETVRRVVGVVAVEGDVRWRVDAALDFERRRA